MKPNCQLEPVIPDPQAVTIYQRSAEGVGDVCLVLRGVADERIPLRRRPCHRHLLNVGSALVVLFANEPAFNRRLDPKPRPMPLKGRLLARLDQLEGVVNALRGDSCSTCKNAGVRCPESFSIGLGADQSTIHLGDNIAE